MIKLKAAVFLDRDGVINVDRTDYVKSRKEFRFIPGVRPALRRLRKAGLPVIVITNQSAVNRGFLSPETLEQIHNKMVQGIEKGGGRISGIYYCPHRPDEGCQCRKPEAGLLLRAVRDLNVDVSRSFMVGDTLRDLRAGNRVGCRTILVLTGQGRNTLKNLAQAPQTDCPGFITPDLRGAAEIITAATEGGNSRARRDF